MINSIKLENTATYESVEFSGLQRENFIYGANGSGKTTLSNYLIAPDSSEYKDCSISWKNNIPSIPCSFFHLFILFDQNPSTLDAIPK